jgi:hypothetical protein
MIASAATAVGSGIKGAMDDRKAGQLYKKQIAQTEYDYNQRAPLRRQGMQALGQVEAPMDLGNLGFNSANPFAAARGKAPSTASYGDWGRMTTDPDVIDNAIAGVTDEDLAWANDAVTRKRPDGSWAYKASERNHAQKQILDPARQRSALAGITPRRGMQPLRPRTSPAPTSYSGMQPLGEEL